MSPEEFIEEMALERGLSPETSRPRLGYLKMFHAALPRPLEECSTRDIKLTLQKMRGRYTSNTFGMMLYLIKKYLEWAGAVFSQSVQVSHKSLLGNLLTVEPFHLSLSLLG